MKERAQNPGAGDTITQELHKRARAARRGHEEMAMDAGAQGWN